MPSDNIGKRRRVRSYELGVIVLERLEFTNQPVVFDVGNFWGIENVIQVIMMPNLLTQALYLGNDIF